MNALVTGGTGFIGMHLVRRLREEGENVRCLVRPSTSRSKRDEIRRMGVQIIEADCEAGPVDAACVAGVTHVFHLAGMTRARTREDYYRGNVLVTKHLLELCAAYRGTIERFVVVSSLAAVGPAMKGIPVTEETPCHPVSEYGRSKLQAETIARTYMDRLPIVILRPAAVYGPGDRDLLSYFQMILKHLFPTVGRSTQQVNIVSWKDVVDAILLASSSPAANGKTYIIGDAVEHASEEIGRTIARTVGRRPLTIRLPYVVAYTVAALSEAFGWMFRRPVFLNREKLSELLADAWTCSIARAQEELHFRPSVSLDEGIRTTYRWYRQMGWL